LAGVDLAGAFFAAATFAGFAFFGAGRAADLFGIGFFDGPFAGAGRFAPARFGLGLGFALALAADFFRAGFFAGLFFIDLLALLDRAVFDFLAATRRLLGCTGFPPGRLPFTTSRDDKGFRR
jgi:hypothetical protein